VVCGCSCLYWDFGFVWILLNHCALGTWIFGQAYLSYISLRDFPPSLQSTRIKGVCYHIRLQERFLKLLFKRLVCSWAFGWFCLVPSLWRQVRAGTMLLTCFRIFVITKSYKLFSRLWMISLLSIILCFLILYIWVHIYIYVYICIYIHKYIYVYIYIYIYTQTYTHICIYMHVCVYICVYICIYVCVCMYVYVYVYSVHVHIQGHLYVENSILFTVNQNINFVITKSCMINSSYIIQLLWLLSSIVRTIRCTISVYWLWWKNNIRDG
jgi:hypothetical protein